MKKSYINLRHQEYTDVKHCMIKKRINLLSQLTYQSCTLMLNYLRLAEIVLLYRSVQSNHRSAQFRRYMLNYLITTNRIFTKWQQKEFLDLLILDMAYNQPNPLNQHNWDSQGQNNLQRSQVRVTGPVQWRSNGSASGNVNDNETGNDRSRINRYKESINNDVERTYFKKLQKKRSSHLSSKQNSILNSMNERRIKSQATQNMPKPQLQVSNIQAYPYFLTLSTQPATLIGPKKTSLKQLQKQSACLMNQIPAGVQHLSIQQHMHLHLKHTLLSTSQKYPQIGYIQGFNYIVKNMFLTGFTEQQSSQYLSYFLEQRSLGKILLNSMSGIKKLSYVLKVYLYNYIPKIYKYFQQSQVEPEVFCTSWFVTLFSEDLGVDLVNKIWHLFVLEGWKIFVKFGVGLICAYQNQILAKESDQIFAYMRRILEVFNQDCKNSRYGRSNRIWERSLKKDEIVWKLMASVEVDGAIMAQLCRQMTNMHNDSQIQIWRLQQQNKLQSSRKYPNPQKPQNQKQRISHECLLFQGQQRKVTENSTCSLNPRSSKICCDRLSNTEMVHCVASSNSNRSSSNIFSLCHNVDTCDACVD